MRVVLDTNTMISAILFASGRSSWIREEWTFGRIAPLVADATAMELIRALACPEFGLDANEIQVMLGTYLPYAEVVALTPAWPDGLPHCRDADDDKFLQLAATGSATVLVTGDTALLELAGLTPCAIEPPAAFRRRCSSSE